MIIKVWEGLSPGPIGVYAYASYGPVFMSICVRLSQAEVLSKRLNESSWLLARDLPSPYPTLCISKLNGTFLWNFIINSGLKIFCFALAYRSRKRVIDLALQRWTLRA